MNYFRRMTDRGKRWLTDEHDNIAGHIFRMSFLVLLVIDCIENTSIIYSDGSWLKGMYFFRNLLYLLLLMKVAFGAVYLKEELVKVGITLLVGFASLLGSGDFGLFKFWIIAAAAKDESVRETVAEFVWIKGISIAVTLVLWRAGILPELQYANGTDGYYNTYGFCHRNVLGANVTILCLAWFYLHYHKIKLRQVVIWSAAAVLTFCLSVSRTSIITIFLIIAAMFGFQKKERDILKHPKLETIVLGGFLGILLLSIMGTICYSPNISVWAVIDKIFTKRLRFSNYCFREYGLSLFGQKIPFVSSIQAQNTNVDKLILDNAYMRLILYYGIVPAALFLTVYFKALKRSVREKDCALLVSLVVFAVYGISERYMLDVYYAFPLLICWAEYFDGSGKSGSLERKKPMEYARDIIQYFRGKQNEFSQK